DVPDTARDTVLDVDHIRTGHPPLTSGDRRGKQLVHVISFRWLDARWTPRRGVTGQMVSNPGWTPVWTPVWTGVGHQSGHRFGTGLESKEGPAEETASAGPGGAGF